MTAHVSPPSLTKAILLSYPVTLVCDKLYHVMSVRFSQACLYIVGPIQTLQVVGIRLAL